jgi:2-C-methyl-D-erythritol 4-phosphate cytidylyltransferase
VGGDVCAVVVAAGSGSRFGGRKQFTEIGGRPVVEWSVAAARTVASAVILVVPEDSTADPRLVGLADVVVAGGASRAASVRCGLAASPQESDIVVVHDAARPLASAGLFRAVVDAVEAGADGAVPGLPVTDTVKRVEDGTVVATVARDDLVTVQTPQAFRLAVLRAAHAGEPEATDDAALLEGLGAAVAVVPGERRNLKLTSHDDLEILEMWSRT